MGRRTRRADDAANHLNDFAPVLSRAVDLASPKILNSSIRGSQLVQTCRPAVASDRRDIVCNYPVGIGSSHGPIPGNPAVTGCLATILLSLRDKAPEPLTGLKPLPKPLEGRSTKDLLDIFPGRLPFAIVHVNVGLGAARQVALKGVRFCSEQVVGVDDFGHKGNILALDSP